MTDDYDLGYGNMWDALTEAHAEVEAYRHRYRDPLLDRLEAAARMRAGYRRDPRPAKARALARYHQDPEPVKAAVMAWKKAHPEAVAAYSRARQARLRTQTRPVHVAWVRGKWRVREPGRRLARGPDGVVLDGGGYSTRGAAEARADEINGDPPHRKYR